MGFEWAEAAPPRGVGSFRATVILETYGVICVPQRKVKPFAARSRGGFWRLAVPLGKISVVKMAWCL